MVPPCVRQRARRALTLIELLVIWMILALLVAILLPSICVHHGGGQRVVCCANIRGIAQAALTYSEADAGESVIPVGASVAAPGLTSHLAAYSYGGRSGRGSGGVNSPWALGAGLGAADRPLNGLLYRNVVSIPAPTSPDEAAATDAALALDIYRCPSDQAFAEPHHRAWRRDALSAYDHYGTSYAANILFARCDSAPERLVSISPYGRALSTIPAPTSTVLFAENAARFAFLQCSPTCPPDCALRGLAPATGAPAGVHNGVFVVAFADGHASAVGVSGHDPAPLAAGQRTPDLTNWHIQNSEWRLDALLSQPLPERRGPGGKSHMSLLDREIQTGDPPTPDFALVTATSP